MQVSRTNDFHMQLVEISKPKIQIMLEDINRYPPILV